MLRRVQTSLQIKLILAFLVVVLIPTAAIAAYNLLYTREALLKRISVEQLRVAEARASAAESRIAEGGADLLFVVQSPAMRRFARGEAGALDEVAGTFQDFLQQSAGRYSGLCLLAMDGGEAVCVRRYGNIFQRTPERTLVDRADTAMFQGALRQAGIPDGNLIAIAVDGREGAGGMLRYSILYPDDEGLGAGVLVLESPLAPILATLVDPGPGVNSLVVDADGTCLIDRQRGGFVPADRWCSLADKRPNDAQTVLRQSAGTIIDSQDRPGQFQVFLRVHPRNQSAAYWTVIYEQPLSQVEGEVWPAHLVIMGVTAIALALALGLAQLLTSEIVRPVRALVAAADRIGADDLGAPIPSQGHDELGALGRSLERTVARLREALVVAEGRRKEAETLRAATQALGSTLARARVLALILSELRKVVPYDSASVQELVGDEAVIIGSYGTASAEAINRARFALVDGETPNAEVVRLRAPVILADAPAVYPIFTTAPFNADPIRSWLGVPMIFGDRLIGLLTLDKYEPGFFSGEHARLVAAFAAQAAAAMENARLYETVHRELADRRRAEAAHARLVAIIEATTDLVGMADMEGRILFLNSAGRLMLNIPADEDLSAIRVADFYPEHRHDWLRTEAISGAISQGTWSGETVVSSRGGSEIPVSQVIIAHRGPDGAPEFLSTIVRDMRERRKAELDLRQAQKMEALGRLAGGMAHDFNNLLTVILGEVDMLLEDIPAGSPMVRAAEQIRHAGARAATLTRQLLAFSRRQVLQPELIDLNAVVAGMEQMLRRLLGEDISLIISLAPHLALVRADPGQIEQVVMNLCINGRDAMPSGGQLVVQTAAVLLDQHYVCQHPEISPGHYTMLAVSDTGAGMDEETRAHVFEPFFTTKDRGKGTGLGLATVHGIVRQSGGHIWFYSEPGLGTCFKVYLPASMLQQVQVEASGAAAPARVASETVLLVEDDEYVRKLTRQILVRQGYAVLEAADGPAALALERAYEGEIHLLLTDVVMPGGLNGVQLATDLRARRPELHVVYMSGYTDSALVSRSLHEEGARYLQKPFTPAELTRILGLGLRDER